MVPIRKLFAARFHGKVSVLHQKALRQRVIRFPMQNMSWH